MIREAIPCPVLQKLLVMREIVSRQFDLPNAHGGQQDLLLLPSALAKTCDNLPSTGAPKRMSKGNGATTNVHLGVVDLQLVQAVNRHAGKSLVQFNDVAVVDCDVELLQKLRDGQRWADSHDAGSETSDSSADELGHDGLAKLDSP